MKAMTMGEYIRNLRKKNNMTQEQLGKKLSPPVNRAAINKWESGQVENIKRSYIEQMSSLFNVRPTELMCFEDEPVQKNKYIQLRPDESHLLGNYNLLNDNGKDKAQEYVEDLSDNPKYTAEVWLNAAHQRTDTELSGTSHDDDIMDDDSGWN